MKHTSAEAAKLLRKLNETHAGIRSREEQSSTFVAAVQENLEDARPAYNYGDVQKELESLEAQIRKVKHAINQFNVSTEVPGTGMTIDEVLVYIPQLSERKRKLTMMAQKLPKERLNSSAFGGKAIVEYSYANYDIEAASADLLRVTDELAKVQTALDVVNNSETLELDL